MKPGRSVPGILGALLLLCAWGTASAQSAAPRRASVTVVLSDAIARTGEPFVIERRPDLARDLIVIRPNATADDLSNAIRSLLTLRQAAGDSAAARMTMRMRPASASGVRDARHPLQRRPFPWAPRVLADLRRAGTRDIPGIGRARSVDIWLPRQHRHARR